MQKSLIGTRNYCDLHPHPCTSATCPYTLRIVGDKGQWAGEDAEKVASFRDGIQIPTATGTLRPGSSYSDSDPFHSNSFA